VDDAVLFLARLSGGAIASFEATRVATGYHNANRFEIHGERGALRFDFERMNELGFYSLDTDSQAQGWTTIDVTRAGSGHPVRRGVVARQPRPRLRAQLHQPGQ
jgi:predicted dehydrogenase